MNNQTLIKRDLEVFWHPCSQMKDYTENYIPLIPIKKAQGVLLYDYDGKNYIDAVSSWWVNLFGHNNAYIKNAIKKQLDNLEHVIMAGFTHESAVQLCERLIKLCNCQNPSYFSKVFFADNGSSGVEAAIKMAHQYRRNRGELEKSGILALKNSYHGETIGALSVGEVEFYKKTYSDLLFQTHFIAPPKTNSLQDAKIAAKNFKIYLKENHQTLNCFIIEPIIQCAGGMQMQHPFYVQEVYRMCKSYDVLVIADEIAVGFGRTGKMFGSFYAQDMPDIMLLSKGITGGYLPLCVLVTTQKIYDTFYDDYFSFKAFLQSHSYTANALACAAANATLDLFEQIDVLGENKKMAQYIQIQSQGFLELECIKAVRQSGTVLAVEIQAPAQKRVGVKLYKYGLKHGVVLRPLGNVFYLFAPYVITQSQISYCLQTAYDFCKKESF